LKVNVSLVTSKTVKLVQPKTNVQPVTKKTSIMTIMKKPIPVTQFVKVVHLSKLHTNVCNVNQETLFKLIKPVFHVTSIYVHSVLKRTSVRLVQKTIVLSIILVNQYVKTRTVRNVQLHSFVPHVTPDGP